MLFAMLTPFPSTWLFVIIFHLEIIIDHEKVMVCIVVISVRLNVDKLNNLIYSSNNECIIPIK